MSINDDCGTKCEFCGSTDMNKKINNLESLILDNTSRLMENSSRENEIIENTEKLSSLLEITANEIKTAIIQKLEEIIRFNILEKPGVQPSININIGVKNDDK